MIKRYISYLTLVLVIFSFLGCTPDDSIDVLLNDLQSPPEEITIKILAIEKLKTLKDPKAIPYLIPVLSDNNPQVRLNAAECLVIYGKELPAETIPQLKENLASNSDRIRTEIMDILSKIGRPAIPALRRALQSNNSFIKLSAIRILGEIGDKKVIYDLIQTLESTKSEQVQVLCAISLAKLKSPAAIESLQRLLNTSKSYDVKVSAIRAIGELQSKDSAILLIKLLEDKKEKPGLKVEAIRALESMDIKTSELKKSLVKLVSSNNDKLRMESIYYLFKLGDSRGMKFLREDVDEKYPAQAQMAIIVLGRTGDTSKKTVASLKKALKFENETLTILAAKSLVQCGNEDGRKIIIECLRSCKETGNKLISIDYIAELKIKEASPILIELFRGTKDFGMINSLLKSFKVLQIKDSIPELKAKYLELAAQPELKIVIVELLVNFHTPEAKTVLTDLYEYEEGKDRYFRFELNKIIKGW